MLNIFLEFFSLVVGLFDYALLMKFLLFSINLVVHYEVSHWIKFKFDGGTVGTANKYLVKKLFEATETQHTTNSN